MMPDRTKRKPNAATRTPRSGEGPAEFDRTREARRRWEERGWPTSQAMAAAVSVMHAGRMVRGGLDKLVEPFGMSYSHYEVLGVLSFSREARMPMNKLSMHLRLHPASLTNTVDRLAERDWVRRVADPSDRRMVYVELTPLGQEVVSSATEAIGAANFGMGNLRVDQLDALAEIIRELRLSYGLFVDDAQ